MQDGNTALLENKNIENRFIVFQNIPHCRSTFAALIEQSPKHVFWTHQALLQVSKNVDLSFYFLHTGIKTSHSVPSQNYTVDDSSNRCFECLKMQLFGPKCESSHCHGDEWSVFGGWFSWFLGTGDHFLGRVPARVTFIGFGSSWNTHSVDCRLLLGSYA